MQYLESEEDYSGYYQILNKESINIEEDLDFIVKIVSAKSNRLIMHRFVDFINEVDPPVAGFKDIILGMCENIVKNAHIRWHQAGGPDVEQNGIALCTMHHKLFDRGVFTLTNYMRLEVAENAHGTNGFEEWVMRYHGKEVRPPQSPLYRPKESYVNWHIKEVFQGPARYVCKN